MLAHLTCKLDVPDQHFNKRNMWTKPIAAAVPGWFVAPDHQKSKDKLRETMVELIVLSQTINYSLPLGKYEIVDMCEDLLMYQEIVRQNTFFEGEQLNGNLLI